jgi:hypothetical protein
MKHKMKLCPEPFEMMRSVIRRSNSVCMTKNELRCLGIENKMIG